MHGTQYFAGCLRAQEGSITQLDQTTMAYHISEPLGVVGQIIPWNFPVREKGNEERGGREEREEGERGGKGNQSIAL